MSITEPQPIAANEVQPRAERRKFTAKYKATILAKLNACNSTTEKGAVLRKEGLYSSLVTKWKQHADGGALSALAQKRGPKPKRSLEAIEVERLKREVERLNEKLRRAECILDVQKKLSEILGMTLNSPPPYEGDSERK